MTEDSKINGPAGIMREIPRRQTNGCYRPRLCKNDFQSVRLSGITRKVLFLGKFQVC